MLFGLWQHNGATARTQETRLQVVGGSAESGSEVESDAGLTKRHPPFIPFIPFFCLTLSTRRALALGFIKSHVGKA